MKQSSIFIVFVMSLVVAGCGTSAEPSVAEDKSMRDGMSKPFDINNVPEKDRAAVLAHMGKPGAPPASGTPEKK